MRLFMLIPLALVAGCATAPQTSLDALCTASRQLRTALAAALAQTPDDRAAVTGANLIEAIDAGCGGQG